MSENELTDIFIDWCKKFQLSEIKSENNMASSSADSIELFIDSKHVLTSKVYLIKVIHLLKSRASTLNDLYERSKYFFIEPLEYDKNGLEKYWNEEAKKYLFDFFQELQNHPPTFISEELEKFLNQFAETRKIKIGTIANPLRLALTGNTVSPGIFDVMEVLGKEIVLKRVENFKKK